MLHNKQSYKQQYKIWWFMGNFLLLYTKYQCLVSMVLWKYKCCWNLRSVVIYLLLFGCQNCLSVTAHDILTLFITQDVVQSNLLLCQVLHYSLILPEMSVTAHDISIMFITKNIQSNFLLYQVLDYNLELHNVKVYS